MITKPNKNLTPFRFQKPSIQLIPNQVLRPVRSAESLLQQPQENIGCNNAAAAAVTTASASVVKTRSPNRAQAQKKAARKVRTGEKTVPDCES